MYVILVEAITVKLLFSLHKQVKQAIFTCLLWSQLHTIARVLKEQATSSRALPDLAIGWMRRWMWKDETFPVDKFLTLYLTR